MHTLENTAWLLTKENYQKMNEIFLNEWKPQGLNLGLFADISDMVENTGGCDIVYGSVLNLYIFQKGNRLFVASYDQLKNSIDNFNEVEQSLFFYGFFVQNMSFFTGFFTVQYQSIIGLCILDISEVYISDDMGFEF